MRIIRRAMTALLAALLTLGIIAAGLAEASGGEELDMMGSFFERHGALRVSDARLVDAAGAPVQLRGVSTLGLAWYPQYVNEAAFRTLRDDWGANTVRLAMYTCEDGGYMTDGDREQLEALIDDGVRYCSALGMYVIIDWHILSDGDPNTHADAAVDFFDRMSARYADRANVLYELCNEPNGSRVSWPVIRRYAERVIPVIRANAPEAVILCGTPNWSQEVGTVLADPLDDQNTMYVLHFYAATHRAGLRAKAKAAIDAGVPVFISEFSICEASGNGKIDYVSAGAWRDLIEKYNLSYIAWSLSNRDEAAALIRADCEKTSGWTEDDLTDSGKWLVGALREDLKKQTE